MMEAYSVKHKQKMVFEPKQIKLMKNGTYLVQGVSKQGDKLSKIVSKAEGEKIKAMLK